MQELLVPTRKVQVTCSNGAGITIGRYEKPGDFV